MKNLLLLVALTFVTISYAKHPVQGESLHEAQNFKVERPEKEKTAGRAFAGAKAKKEKNVDEVHKDEIPMSEDSDVRFWRYSE